MGSFELTEDYVVLDRRIPVKTRKAATMTACNGLLK